MSNTLLKSMIVDGPMGTQAIDSSGEILDIEGADISLWQEGKGVLNYEHKTQGGEDADDGVEKIGKIIYAKKIFSKKDCEDSRQEMYWDQVKLPFIYGKARLFDSGGHEGAKALAAIIRDCEAHEEPLSVGWSVEGSTLKKEGPVLKRTVLKEVAVTFRPCNKQAVMGLVVDTEGKAISTISTKKSEMENPALKRLGANLTFNVQPGFFKALEAGNGNTAADSAVQGAAMSEDRLEKFRAAIKSWDGKGSAREFLKSKLEDVSDEYLDHFETMLDEHRFKVKKMQELLLPLIPVPPPPPELDHFRALGELLARQNEIRTKGESSIQPTPPKPLQPVMGPVDQMVVKGEFLTTVVLAKVAKGWPKDDQENTENLVAQDQLMDMGGEIQPDKAPRVPRATKDFKFGASNEKVNSLRQANFKTAGAAGIPNADQPGAMWEEVGNAAINSATPIPDLPIEGLGTRDVDGPPHAFTFKIEQVPKGVKYTNGVVGPITVIHVKNPHGLTASLELTSDGKLGRAWRGSWAHTVSREQGDGVLAHIRGWLDSQPRHIAKAINVDQVQAWPDHAGQQPLEVDFKGKKVSPGHGYHAPTKTQHAVLDVTPEHWVGVPMEKLGSWDETDLKAFPRDESNFLVNKLPEFKDVSGIVDASKDLLPGFNNHPDSAKLVHGLDLHGKGEEGKTGINRKTSKWLTNANGVKVYVKGDRSQDIKRDQVFHNLARDYFGIGHMVPSQALFRNPKNGANVLAVEKVDGHHIEDLTDSQAREAQAMNVASGDSDKASFVDAISHNIDRSKWNFLYAKDGKLKLIDSQYDPKAAKNGPSYETMAHLPKDSAFLDTPVSPATRDWLLNLNPVELGVRLSQYKMPRAAIRLSQRGLRALQAAAAAGATRRQMYSAHEHAVLGDPNEPTRPF